jgi:integrase
VPTRRATKTRPPRPRRPELRGHGERRKGAKRRSVPLRRATGRATPFRRQRAGALRAKTPGILLVRVQPTVLGPRARDGTGPATEPGIKKKVSPHKLRYIYATHRLHAGADRVDIKALRATRASAPPRFTPTSGRRGWSRWWGGCDALMGERQCLTSG